MNVTDIAALTAQFLGDYEHLAQGLQTALATYGEQVLYTDIVEDLQHFVDYCRALDEMLDELQEPRPQVPTIRFQPY